MNVIEGSLKPGVVVPPLSFLASLKQAIAVHSVLLAIRICIDCSKTNDSVDDDLDTHIVANSNKCLVHGKL